MYKNCDASWDVFNGNPANAKPPQSSQRLVFSSTNPAVLSDGRCYLRWMAESLKMDLREESMLSDDEQTACNMEKGDKNDKVSFCVKLPQNSICICKLTMGVKYEPINQYTIDRIFDCYSQTGKGPQKGSENY